MKLERTLSIGALGLSLCALPKICESGCETVRTPIKEAYTPSEIKVVQPSEALYAPKKTEREYMA